MRRGLLLLAVLLLLGGGLAITEAQAPWAGCRYLTAGTNITITCPDTVGRGGATIAGSGGGLPSGLTFSSPTFTVATGVANQVVLSGSTATNPVTITVTGSDTNIPITLATKGTGPVIIPGGGAVAKDAMTFLGAEGLLMAGTDADFNTALNLSSANATPGNGASGVLNFYAVNGTYASPTKSLANDFLGLITFNGYTGAALAQQAKMQVYAVTDGNAVPFKTTLNIRSQGTSAMEMSLNGDTDTLTFATDFTGTPELVIGIDAVTVNGTLEIASGGSTTISTGVGSVKMSTANAATNTSWIPIKYAGTTYYVPGWTTNAP